MMPAVMRRNEERAVGDHDLAVLARRIGERERRAGRDLLEHAREQGEDLLRVQEQVGERKFAPWLRENIPGLTERTANNYKRIAREWAKIPETVSGIGEALRHLRLLAAGDESEGVRADDPATTALAPLKSKKQPPAEPSLDDDGTRAVHLIAPTEALAKQFEGLLGELRIMLCGSTTPASDFRIVLDAMEILREEAYRAL